MSVICLIPQDNIFNPDWFKISGINGELNENDIKELSSNNEKKEMKRNINNNKGIEEITEKMDNISIKTRKRKYLYSVDNNSEKRICLSSDKVSKMCI